MMILESLVAAFVYVSSFVVTLRAGSRALYLLTHDGNIGVMDGPLIIGPTDLEKKNNNYNFTEISPLWQSTFGFRQAVNISLQQQPQPNLTLKLQRKTKEGIEGIILWLKESKKFLRFKKKDHSDTEDGEDGDLDYDLVVESTMPIPATTTLATTATSNDHNEVDIVSPSYPIPKTVNVKAYAPTVFSKLRKRFGVSDSAFIKSFLHSGPYVSFQSNSKGAARAGGFFFFTRDGAYMVKTIKKAEIDTFFEMLPKYCKYMKRNAKRSLLTRFFGIYSVQVKEEERYLSEFWGFKKESNEDEHYFVIMNAVFPAEGDKFITERFDLKGSTVGRECSIEEREKKGSNAVLKDLDLIQQCNNDSDAEVAAITLQKTRCGLNIGAQRKSELLLQIRKDVELLVECNVMDYSLLVGVVNLDYLDSYLVSNHFNQDGIHPSSPRYQFWIPRMSKRMSKLLSPLRLMMAPPMYMCSKIHTIIDKTVSSVLTLPLPYYGAGICGVDGGAFSVIRGRKQGRKTMFYLGIIDFLQPWTTRKVLEKELKGLLGYDTMAISCVDPKIYAERFIHFLDANIS